MLMATAQKDTNWRVRERAQTVLHFDAGHSAEAVAELMGLHVRTVSSTRTAWLAQGFASLPDLARAGAPEKLLAYVFSPPVLTARMPAHPVDSDVA